MNGYTKTGFVMSKVFGIFLMSMYSPMILVFIILGAYGYDEWPVLLISLLGIFLHMLVIFWIIRYYFSTYTIDKGGILIKDGFKKDFLHISWKECNYIRTANVVVWKAAGIGMSVDGYKGLPYMIFSKEPIDLSYKHRKKEKETDDVLLGYGLRTLKLVMIPMTPQNVDFVNKFFDVESLLQAEPPENCYDWQDPKTWGKDQ